MCVTGSKIYSHSSLKNVFQSIPEHEKPTTSKDVMLKIVEEEMVVA